MMTGHESIETPGDVRGVNWRSVALFYLIACGVSWPFFWWRDIHTASWAQWQVPWPLNKGWAPALGPATAAAVALVVYRRTHRRTVSLLGSSWIRSLIFAGIPIAGLTVVGVGSEQPHLTGLVFGLSYLLYALGEEAGWRGFLQDALRPLRPLPRYLLIGILWWAWHLTSFARGEPGEAAMRLGLMALLCVLGSWGIGKAVDASHSLFVAAMLHLLYNLFRAVPMREILPAMAVSIAAWVILLRSWPQAASAATSIRPPPDSQVAAEAFET